MASLEQIQAILAEIDRDAPVLRPLFDEGLQHGRLCPGVIRRFLDDAGLSANGSRNARLIVRLTSWRLALGIVLVSDAAFAAQAAAEAAILQGSQRRYGLSAREIFQEMSERWRAEPRVIARFLGVAETTVRAFLRRFGLPLNVPPPVREQRLGEDPNRLFRTATAQRIERQHGQPLPKLLRDLWDETQSAQAIAEQLNVSDEFVHERLKRLLGPHYARKSRWHEDVERVERSLRQRGRSAVEDVAAAERHFAFLTTEFGAATRARFVRQGDLTQLYKSELGRYPLITEPEDWRQLVERFRAGDFAARQELILHNLRLAFSIAAQFRSRVSFLSLDDLVQEANLGLIKAVHRWDPSLGSFSTYATFWCVQAIRLAIANGERLVRVPVHMHEARRKLAWVAQQFLVKEGRPATVEELTFLCGLLPSTVRIAERVNRERFLAPEDLLGEGPGKFDPDQADQAAAHLFGASAAPRPDLLAEVQSNLEQCERRETAVLGALEGLPFRTQILFCYRQGLSGFEWHTLEGVAAKVGLTRERVRKLETRAFRKIGAETGLTAQDIAALGSQLQRFQALSELFA